MERKNKGGRPKSSRVHKKSRAVTIRYSALQYDIVRHRARTAGYRTLTEYVREASVNAEVVQNFIHEHNAAFRDLSGLCNNLKAYGIRAEIKFRSGTHIPQGISFTRDGTTFKGSSLDRSLSFSKIDKVLTGGVNIDAGGQAQDHSAYESSSNDQDYSLTTDLSMLAADLAIGLICFGQEKKSEEQDLAQNKKRGPRL